MVSNAELHTLNLALGSSGGSFSCCNVLCWALFCILSQLSNMFSSSAANSCYGCSEASSVTIEGPLRRKTLLKEGRKPRVRWSLISLCFFLSCGWPCQQIHHLMTVSEVFSGYPFTVLAVLQLSSWTRFWITLSGSTLTFYGAKALRASERKHVSLMLNKTERLCRTGHTCNLSASVSIIYRCAISVSDKSAWIFYSKLVFLCFLAQCCCPSEHPTVCFLSFYALITCYETLLCSI